MKQVLEQDIWNAFENMLNKLWFAKSIIFDVYSKHLVQNEKDVIRDDVEKLNKTLASIQSEKRRLSLLIQREFGSPSIQQRHWELEIRENSVMKEIEQMKNRSKAITTLNEMRASLDKWKKGGDLDAAFTELIESVSVMRDKYVIFKFKNGLKLKESLVK